MASTLKGQYRRKQTSAQSPVSSVQQPENKTAVNIPSSQQNSSAAGILRQWFLATILLILPVILVFIYKADLPNSSASQPTEILVSEQSSQLPKEKGSVFAFNPGQGAILQGELFEIQLTFDASLDTIPSNLTMQYQPNLISVEEVIFSDSFASSHSHINNDRGEVVLGGLTNPGFTGKNLVATIAYKALGEGITTIDLNSNQTQNAAQFTAQIVKENYDQPKVNCTQQPPSVPSQLTAIPGPGLGEVTLSWKLPSLGVTNAAIHYGVSPGYYQFGIPSIGRKEKFVISNLEPGKTYYFSVSATSMCAVSPLSGEAVAKAGFGTMTQEQLHNTTLTPPIAPALIPSEHSNF